MSHLHLGLPLRRRFPQQGYDPLVSVCSGVGSRARTASSRRQGLTGVLLSPEVRHQRTDRRQLPGLDLETVC
jgi:hypothetical protein